MISIIFDRLGLKEEQHFNLHHWKFALEPFSTVVGSIYILHAKQHTSNPVVCLLSLKYSVYTGNHIERNIGGEISERTRKIKGILYKHIDSIHVNCPTNTTWIEIHRIHFMFHFYTGHYFYWKTANSSNGMRWNFYEVHRPHECTYTISIIYIYMYIIICRKPIRQNHFTFVILPPPSPPPPPPHCIILAIK